MARPPLEAEQHDEDLRSRAYEKATQFLCLAARPPLKPAGETRVADDTQHADREALIGVGWAMLELADALRNPRVPVDPGPCGVVGPKLLPGAFPAWCNLRAGHLGMHEGWNGATWGES